MYRVAARLFERYVMPLSSCLHRRHLTPFLDRRNGIALRVLITSGDLLTRHRVIFNNLTIPLTYGLRHNM